MELSNCHKSMLGAAKVAVRNKVCEGTYHSPVVMITILSIAEALKPNYHKRVKVGKYWFRIYVISKIQ